MLFQRDYSFVAASYTAKPSYIMHVSVLRVYMPADLNLVLCNDPRREETTAHTGASVRSTPALFLLEKGHARYELLKKGHARYEERARRRINM